MKKGGDWDGRGGPDTKEQAKIDSGGTTAAREVSDVKSEKGGKR